MAIVRACKATRSTAVRCYSTQCSLTGLPSLSEHGHELLGVTLPEPGGRGLFFGRLAFKASMILMIGGPTLSSGGVATSFTGDFGLHQCGELIDVTRAKQADLEDYRNVYNDKLSALVQAKIAGKEIATPPDESVGPPVINIMDALKASLEKKRPRRPGSGKVTPSTRARAKAPAKRRKSG